VLHILCVCSLKYRACNAHAPCYTVICRLSCSSTPHPPHYLTNGTISEEKNIEYKMCVFIFFTNLSDIFFILRSPEWYMSKNVCGSSGKVQYRCYSCQILMKLEVSIQIFEKILRYQNAWKFAQWETSCSMRKEGRADGQTDIHTWRS